MIDVSIRRIRIPTDGRGFISSGKMQDGRPVKLDHWDTTDFEEIVAVYGDKPKTIYVRFYSDELESVFEDEFVRWVKSKAAGSKGTKARTCTGCECVHRIEEEVHGQRYTAGEISECVCTEMADDDPMRCKYGAHLKAVIVDPSTYQPVQPIIYGFRTTSRNNGDAIYNELLKTRMLFGHITDVVFALSVKMCESRTDARKRFPLWELRAVSGAEPALEQGSQSAMLPEAKPAELPQAKVEEAPATPVDAAAKRKGLLTVFGELRSKYKALTGKDFNVPAMLEKKNVSALDDLTIADLEEIVQWAFKKVEAAIKAGESSTNTPTEPANTPVNAANTPVEAGKAPAQEAEQLTAEEIEERERLLALAEDLWKFHRPGLHSDWCIRQCLTITGNRTSDRRNLSIQELDLLIEKLRSIKSLAGQEAA